MNQTTNLSRASWTLANTDKREFRYESMAIIRKPEGTGGERSVSFRYLDISDLPWSLGGAPAVDFV